jgi:hypothetical protein
MAEIIKMVQEELADTDNKSYLFFRWLATKWIYNTPLNEIIADRIGFLRAQGNSSQSVSSMIRDLLRDLEKEIRFRLVKYYMAYVGLLEVLFRERGNAVQAESIEPFHVYLECGASDRIALNLIALGLSRSTALALRKKVTFPEEATPETCMAVLATTQLASLSIPTLCIRELEDLLA